MEYDCLKLENQLCFPLYVCSKEIVRRYKPFLDELDLTYTQYITMMVLWEINNINVKDLGNKLFLDSGTLTPLLKKLESKGYIIRNRDSNDERNVLISITKKGIELKDKALNIPQKVGKCINLDENEVKLLYKILYELINNIKENENE